MFAELILDMEQNLVKLFLNKPGILKRSQDQKELDTLGKAYVNFDEMMPAEAKEEIIAILKKKKIQSSIPRPLIKLITTPATTKSVPLEKENNQPRDQGNPPPETSSAMDIVESPTYESYIKSSQFKTDSAWTILQKYNLSFRTPEDIKVILAQEFSIIQKLTR